MSCPNCTYPSSTSDGCANCGARLAVVIPLRVHRPVSKLRDFVAVSPMVDGGFCVRITVPGCEQVELHPDEHELIELANQIDDARELSEDFAQ